MADVFLSYAREDRETAQSVVQALAAEGYSLWWDPEILGGAPFDEVIERELDRAKVVVVLWSKHSVSSNWVRSEASAAAERGVLVPAFIEKIKPPLEFRRRQTIDLTAWHGDPSAPDLGPMRRAIAAHLHRDFRDDELRKDKARPPATERHEAGRAEGAGGPPAVGVDLNRKGFNGVSAVAYWLAGLAVIVGIASYLFSDLLTWIIVGLVAGVLASLVMGGGYGLIGDIIVGIVGAFVGGWLFRQLGWHAPLAGLAGTIFVALLGAIVLLFLLRLIRRRA